MVSNGPIYQHRGVYHKYDTLNNIAAERDMKVLCYVPDASKKYNYYISAATNEILGCEPINEKEALERDESLKNALYLLQIWWEPLAYKRLIVYNDINNVEDEYGYDSDGNWALISRGVLNIWWSDLEADTMKKY